MFCLEIHFRRYARQARLDAAVVILQDFLLIHGLDAPGSDRIAQAFRGWAAAKAFDRMQLDCREDGLEMTVHFPEGGSDNLLVSGVRCSCLPAR